MGKKLDTNIIHFGSNPNEHYGSINDPIYKNSTLIFNDYDSYLNSKMKNLKNPIMEELALIQPEDLKSLYVPCTTQNIQF